MGGWALEDDEVQMILKDYFEDIYNIDSQVQVVVHMCGSDGVWRGSYFEEEPIRELK